MRSTVYVCFSSEMFGRVDEIVGMPMVVSAHVKSKAKKLVKPTADLRWGICLLNSPNLLALLRN